MIESIDAFLVYFDAVHRRAVRDVAALPPQADGWVPPAGEGENAWSINQLVGHMAVARLYFASAYRGEGWISPPAPDVSTRDSWIPALEKSGLDLRATLAGTPAEWLRRKVDMIDTNAALSGWRVLMMMLEHDIHHRSQIDTYAGLNGWSVPDIYARSAETIGGLQDEQRSRYRA
jgi:uncharacterized damage-inducible protein DinB